MKLPDRLPTENARTYAIRVLLHNILTLELVPGSAVSENELSALLNLSRTPVREALIELGRMGLVEIFPQRGSYISRIDYHLIEESRFMRLVLENAILTQACCGISPASMEALRKNLEASCLCLEQSGGSTVFTDSNARKFLELDNQFHRLLFESVDRSWTYGVIHAQMIHFDRLRALSVKSNDNMRLIRDHEDILYAIERQDEEMARMLMTRHLTRYQADQAKLREQYPGYFKSE